MSLQKKNRLRSTKKREIFFIVHFSRQTNGEGVEPPTPHCVRPCYAVIITEDYFYYALPSVLVAVLCL